MGILITQELDKIYDTSYNIINKKIQKDRTNLSSLLLDFNPRIEVVKMNVLPRLLYLFLSLLVRIQESQCKARDEQISWFIWAGARHSKLTKKTVTWHSLTSESTAKLIRLI